MKKLALTTAMFAAMSFGAVHAQNVQTTPQGETSAAQAQQQQQPRAGERHPMGSGGYAAMAPADRTAANLEDADIYTRDGDDVGSVSEILVGPDGQVTHLVANIGGFLGMGAHTVALPLDQVDVQWSQDRKDPRVYVSMTKDQLRALPEHKN